jgi:urea transporter
VFLIDNAITGVIFVVALAVNSRSAATWAMVSSVVALVVAMALGTSRVSMSSGLYGFSAVLTGIAVGSVFAPRTAGRTWVFTLLAVIFTVVVQGALNRLLQPVGIPTLTAAFVLVTWLCLLPKARLTPVMHEPARSGVIGPAM